MRGVVVSLEPERLHLPAACAACAACGGVASTRKLLTGPLGGGSGISVGCCGECWLHARRWSNTPVKLFVLGVSALLLAIPIGALVKLPLPSVLVLATLVTGAFAVAFLFLAPRFAAYKGRAWPPVRIVASSSQKLVLFCADARWGKELAERSAGTARAAAQPVERFSLLATAACTALGFTLALFAWREVHALLRVDNAGAKPLMLWVDGVRDRVVPPDPAGTRPREVWLEPGTHELGYSEPEGSAPQATVRVGVLERQSLYNPGQTACYVRVESVYAANRALAPAGSERALERSEFYALPGIDDWFKESPDQVKVRSGSSSAKRIALLRNGSCTALAARGCSDAVLSQLTNCQNQASDESSFDECSTAAAAECERAARSKQ